MHEFNSDLREDVDVDISRPQVAVRPSRFGSGQRAERPGKKYSRCKGCGGMVKAPCIFCRLVALET